MSRVTHAYTCTCSACKNGTSYREDAPTPVTAPSRYSLTGIGKALLIATLLLVMLLGLVRTAAAEDIWLYQLAEFNALFADGDDSTLAAKNFTEDGCFSMSDIYGNEWRGALVGSECDEPEIADDSQMVSPTMSARIYLPVVSNAPAALDTGNVCAGQYCNGG